MRIIYGSIGKQERSMPEESRMTKEELNKWNGLIASGNIEYYNIEFNDTYEKSINFGGRFF